MKKRIFLVILIFIFQSKIIAIAQIGTFFTSKDSEGNTLSYKITSENTVMLCRSDKDRIKKPTVNVPETVFNKEKAYTVIDIEPKYFYYRNDFKKVVLPNTLTELPSYPGYDGGVCGFFENCSIQEIVLPKHLKKIGPMAFASCKHLGEVIIPESVVEIGGGCFSYCELIRRVKLPSGIKELGTFQWTSSSGYSYERGFFYLCECLEEIDIPNSVISLGKDCFRCCKKLQEIKIPDKIEKLSDRCFSGCSNLSRIILPKALQSIGKECFYECNNLKTIKGLRHGIKFGQYAFLRTAFREDLYFESFESYVADAVYEVYKWQQKRDFETTAEYKVRVTPENQQKKVQDFLAKAIKEYTDKNKIQVTLGQYDADTEIYTLNSNYGTKYVKIPRSEAPVFKENFSSATFDASYVLVNELPQVADMTVYLNGKSYKTEKTVFENNNHNLAIDLPEIDLGLGLGDNQNQVSKSLVEDRTIDESIPITTPSNTSTFAVIIGNERYTRVAKVPYAGNDARIFAEYCKKTLGLPEQNVKVYENASYGTMIGAVSDIQKIAKAFKGDVNVVFYYAGHGIPDEATGDGYLLPIDADGMNTEVCYPLSRLYKELGELGAKSVVAFLDACFSGAQRGEGMVVAARGVAIKAKSEHPTGHTVVFTAATDKQTAYPYNEKGHGMFTYYLLKKLHDTKGDCTLGELGSYISDEVAKQAVVTNGKEQTPVVLTSDGVSGDWEKMKLK